MDNFHKLPMTHIRATKSRSKDSSVNNGKESISGMSLHNVILRQKSTIINTLRRYLIFHMYYEINFSNINNYFTDQFIVQSQTVTS